MNWRRWVRIIHRDLGYIFFGLTVIYSISGIAVNHVSDWNPNYKIEKSELKYIPFKDSTASNALIINYLQKELSLKDSLINSFRSGPLSMQLFYDGKNINANLAKGIAKIEVISSRALIRESNYLHLNHPKKWWTYIADAFAVGLIILAFTGLFILKGKKGITGRGAWLTAIGLLIPIIFLLIYY